MAEQDKEIKVDTEMTEDETSSPMERFFFHQRKALEETGRALEALLPEGFREHSGNASREFAKGFRILIDAAIDELKRVSEREEEEAAKRAVSSDDDDDNPPSTTGKTKVKVKVD